VPLDRTILKVVFAEEHLVEPIRADAPFELADYYRRPERYRSVFERYLPDLSMIVNCIYWEERYPRLVTRAAVKQLHARAASSPPSAGQPRLQVIGDISCDIEGSIEVTLRNSTIDNPVFVYRPDTDSTEDGVEATGPVIMSIDHLPSEMPADATRSFGDALVDFVAPLTHADFGEPTEALDLPAELRRALIVHRGELTPDFAYLRERVGDKA
jgi:alanine dehydrogenase